MFVPTCDIEIQPKFIEKIVFQKKNVQLSYELGQSN